MLEFLHSHSSVVFQPDFDDPRFSGLNPYALGFAMMSDIQRICDEPTEEDREWFPDIAGCGDAYGVLRHAWANYRDESFILQYLSPAMIRQFRLFHVARRQRASRRCGSRRSTTISATARSAARCRGNTICRGASPTSRSSMSI